MDKGSGGKVVYTLGDTMITTGLKGSCISYRRIALTHSSMSSINERKRSRRKKSAKVTRLFENKVH